MKFLNGEKVGIGLYDIHVHLGGYNRDYHVFYGRTEKIVEEMELLGIKKASDRCRKEGIIGIEIARGLWDL